MTDKYSSRFHPLGNENLKWLHAVTKDILASLDYGGSRPELYRRGYTFVDKIIQLQIYMYSMWIMNLRTVQHQRPDTNLFRFSQ